jgi:ribokinase
MARRCRICVVGSANVDLTFRTPRLPKAGETLAGQSLHLGMGGKGANQAVAAARLGAEVVFVACVGNDTFGDEAMKRFRAEGIDTSFVRQDGNHPTGTAAIVVDDNAENCIVIVPGANAGLSAADVRTAASMIQQADAVLCQLETPIEATVEAFRLARAAGKLTMLTPAPVVELPEELLPLCDVCVPNRTEMEYLAGGPVQTVEQAHVAAMSLRARGVKTVVVTLGPKGALLLNDSAVHIPALAVKAVDTTGAGDAFTAALAVSLANGEPLQDAARRASAVAALTVTQIGTQAAFPHRLDVDEWLASETFKSLRLQEHVEFFG